MWQKVYLFKVRKEKGTFFSRCKTSWRAFYNINSCKSMWRVVSDEQVNRHLTIPGIRRIWSSGIFFFEFIISLSGIRNTVFQHRENAPMRRCGVWYLDRADYLFKYRLLMKLGDDAPFGGIVDVHIQGKPVVQAVDEAVIHDIIHLVRSTFAGSFFADGSCKRMLIALNSFWDACSRLSATQLPGGLWLPDISVQLRAPQMVCRTAV